MDRVAERSPRAQCCAVIFSKVLGGVIFGVGGLHKIRIPSRVVLGYGEKAFARIANSCYWLSGQTPCVAPLTAQIVVSLRYSIGGRRKGRFDFSDLSVPRTSDRK